jgi:hypothetical protein
MTVEFFKGLIPIKLSILEYLTSNENVYIVK